MGGVGKYSGHLLEYSITFVVLLARVLMFLFSCQHGFLVDGGGKKRRPTTRPRRNSEISDGPAFDLRSGVDAFGNLDKWRNKTRENTMRKKEEKTQRGYERGWI